MGRAYSNTPPGAAPAGSIGNSELENMAANTMKANATGSAAAPQDVAVAANKFLARSSAGNLAAKDITDFGLSVLDDSTAATARETLGAMGHTWNAGTFPTSGLLSRIEFVEHFLNIGDALSGFAGSVSGASAALSQGTAPAGRIGLCDLTTGTDTTGRAAVITGVAAILFGGGRHRLRWDMCVANASDGSDTFIARVGYMDSATGEPTDGAFFRYTHSVNSGNWVAVTRSNGVETTTNTAVAVAAGTYRAFEIEVNAAASSVAFYIDGVSIGAAHTANIPSGAGRGTGIIASIIKSAGTTARSFIADLCAWSFEPTAPL